MEAATARLDLKDKASKASYLVVDGSLYAKLVDKASGIITWYFFDSSCRKWAECDDPNQEES